MVKKSRELVVASTSPGKIREIRQLLDHLNIRIRSLGDFENAPVVNEDQLTLEGNAFKKAHEIFAVTGLPTLADDTGLEVAALGGRPGVLSARYAGLDADAANNRAKLLADLRGTRDRAAQFRTSVVYMESPDSYLSFNGICKGVISLDERGSGGFGYDSIFIPEGKNCTFAELSDAEKNQISHRAVALRKLIIFLESNDPIAG